MSEADQIGVRRVLVAIDSSEFGAAALEAAALLARDLQAELHGLFIEDINLIRLAALPFASEVDYLSGALRRLDVAAMERALEQKAEGVRLAIAEAARQARLHWSFKTSRGNWAQTTLAAALEADLFLIGREGSSPATAATRQRRGPIMAVCDASEASQRALEMAQRFADAGNDAIVALVANTEVAPTSKRAAHDISLYVQRCTPEPESLLQAAEKWQPKLVVINRDNQLISESSIDSLVAGLPCPIVLIQ